MTLTNQSILEVLHSIQAPGSHHSLVQAGAVQDLEIDGSTVRLKLAVQVAQPSDIEELRKQCRTVVPGGGRDFRSWISRSSP